MYELSGSTENVHQLISNLGVSGSLINSHSKVPPFTIIFPFQAISLAIKLYCHSQTFPSPSKVIVALPSVSVSASQLICIQAASRESSLFVSDAHIHVIIVSLTVTLALYASIPPRK
jgi:hypothetical protein